MYKRYFPEYKDHVYLDNAATTMTPAKVIMEYNYYWYFNANIHRSPHKLGQEATEKYEQARAVVAEFAGFNSNELIFTRNTTESINLLANALTLSASDLVLVPWTEHHANLLPWRHSIADIEYLELDEKGYIDLAGLNETLKRTKGVYDRILISFAHIGNINGVQQPYKKIVTLAKAYNALIHVDAAQSIVKYKYPDADFVSFSGHKLYGPTGIGCLCVKEKHFDKMDTYQVGGGIVTEVNKHGQTYIDGCGKYEAGTPNIAGALQLQKACEFITNVGREELLAYEKELTVKLKEIVTPVWEDGVNIVTFKTDAHPGDVATLLGGKNIAVRSGMLCAEPYVKSIDERGLVRASISFYNDIKDIEKFSKAYNEVCQLLTK